jgi:outer membrane protein assembly factor BamD
VNSLVSRCFLLTALGLSAVPALAGCVSDAKPPTSSEEYNRHAQEAYEEALREFLDSNWEEAARLMEEVRRNYAYSKYAHQAHLRLADIAFRQEKYPEAIAEYKAYTHDHPQDAEVPYARYRSIRAQFMSSGNSSVQPPLEERDLGSVRDAYESIRAFLADYPDYKEAEELDFMFRSVSGMLARHELYVARFYLRGDRFEAAMARAQYCLRTFAGSGLEPEAVVLLGEVFLKMKQPRRASALFKHVITQYPASPFTITARRFLEFMGEAPTSNPTAAARAALGATASHTPAKAVGSAPSVE